LSKFAPASRDEFRQHIQNAKAEISALLAGERTPQCETNLQTATRIAARSQSTSEAAKGPEPINRKERAHYNQRVKPEEEKALKAWAHEASLWVPETAFNEKYAQRYVDAGAEQKVYLKEDCRKVYKVNTGHFHGTWLDFFIRFLIHKTLFPSTAYTLEGFTEERGQFCAVVEQWWITAGRGASKGEVEAFLSQIGFVNTKANDYYHKEEGLVLEDLHDENVFVGENGNLLFVDPVIYLETADLNLGGVNLFRFPFGTSFK
jgi:hypothetical protein